MKNWLPFVFGPEFYSDRQRPPCIIWLAILCFASLLEKLEWFSLLEEGENGKREKVLLTAMESRPPCVCFVVKFSSANDLVP